MWNVSIKKVIMIIHIHKAAHIHIQTKYIHTQGIAVVDDVSDGEDNNKPTSPVQHMVQSLERKISLSNMSPVKSPSNREQEQMCE